MRERAPHRQDGRFTALRPLAFGGAASVWTARRRRDGRAVALKVAHEASPDGWGHPLWREYEALVRLRSPWLVRVEGRGRARRGPLPAGRPYLILERIEAPPLGRRRRSLPALERLARGVGRALATLHDRRWLHRDLKPGNVLWDPASPRPPILIDLGLAVPIGHRPVAGCICGSLPYVAPEAILGEPLDRRSDLYAFGQLLWRAWVGRSPRRGASPETWLRWHLVGKNPDAGRMRPGLPAIWRWTLRRLTARDRNARPEDVREALRPLGLAPGQVRANAPSDWPRLRACLDRAAAGFPAILWTPDDRWPASLDAREWTLWAAARDFPWFRLDDDPHPSVWHRARRALDAHGALLTLPAHRVSAPPVRALLAQLRRSGTRGLALLHGARPPTWPASLESVLEDLREPEIGSGNAAERGEDERQKDLQQTVRPPGA